MCEVKYIMRTYLHNQAKVVVLHRFLNLNNKGQEVLTSMKMT